MHKLVHNLTMCVLLYHLLVGCCCHHAHTTEAGHWHDANSAMYVAGSGEEHGNHRACPADHGQHRDSGRHRQGCHEGHCVFVVPAMDGVARLVGHINMPTDPDVAHTAVVLTPPVHRVCALPLDTSHVPPLRLHLMNQILLI